MRKPHEIATAFAQREELNGYKSFFLVGIGGAGMSAVAKMLKNRGFAVSGTDSTATNVTTELLMAGINVRIGHSGEDSGPGDAVILSDAIDLDSSPEVARAREMSRPLFRRSQLLGWLMRDKKCICVTGTHGKTTTTGMIGAGLRAAGLDPTIVVGASVPEFGGPVVEGEGEWAVIEACEAYDALHDFDPEVVVLTNLELDHIDFHGTYENLENSVLRFVEKIPASGALIYCREDHGATELASKAEDCDEDFVIESYGLPSIEAEEWEDTALSDQDEWDMQLPPMALPGQHNALNAMGAMMACDHATGTAVTGGCRKAAEGIAAFRGAERRLQVLREGPITVVDDYAHHPAEIEASIQALMERYPERRLVVVYQPHLYSRTANLVPEFAAALNKADCVILTDIYPAREDPMPGVSSARIAECITKPTDYVPSRHLLPQFVATKAHPGDLIVGMGAGNIDAFAPAFIREIDRSGPKKVAVIYGGDSAEREVSLHSGRAVLKALQSLGYDARLVDLTDLLLSSGKIDTLTGANRPDLAFLAVHGTNAEDGATQGLLELLHIPYTGSGIQSSAIAMDKQRTKDILRSKGLPVPVGVEIARSEFEATSAYLESSLSPQLRSALPTLPLIVKPNAQGSTVGLSFVSHESELVPAIEKALHYDKAALVEEWIQGIEISVPVLGGKALPVVEIVPNTGQYDFASKYLPGATEEIVPARLPEHTYKKAQEYAEAAHMALGCRGATRTDMMVRGEDIFILELNTLPGLTGTSLLPNSAKAAGMSFESLVEWMVQDALTRQETNA